MTKEKEQLAIGLSVIAVTKYLMEHYSIGHEEAFKKLVDTKFFEYLNNPESGLCFESDMFLCEACLIELEQGPEAMDKYTLILD
ncbi:MAG: hypothetical protein LUD47_03350 [Clostridia bacterium]|nr:hypothetical protein [Clostridia bacterium]